MRHYDVIRDQLGESSGGEATDLADVFVGQSKDHLDCVDSDLVIEDCGKSGKESIKKRK